MRIRKHKHTRHKNYELSNYTGLEVVPLYMDKGDVKTQAQWWDIYVFNRSQFIPNWRKLCYYWIPF